MALNDDFLNVEHRRATRKREHFKKSTKGLKARTVKAGKNNWGKIYNKGNYTGIDKGFYTARA